MSGKAVIPATRTLRPRGIRRLKALDAGLRRHDKK